MRLLLLFSALLLLPALGAFALTDAGFPAVDFDPPPRKIKIGSRKTMAFIKNGKVDFEIVLPREAGGVAEFAAAEMRALLKKATGKDIAVVSAPSGKVKYQIVLGDCAAFRKTGLDVKKLPRDGFYMRTAGKTLYIAGFDDKKTDVRKQIRKLNWPHRDMDFNRGTLFGVYDFLERFCGMRFYLPTDFGTVIPVIKDLTLPAIDIFDRPDCPVRCTLETRYYKNTWFGNGNPVEESHLNSMRWRLQTFWLPNSHGLEKLGYFKRFGKTNPEFFAIGKNGKRTIDYPGYLCLSDAGLRKEIFLDAQLALKGGNPKERGIVHVSPDGYERSVFSHDVYVPGIFNVHLMDGWIRCACANCQKFYSKAPPQHGEIIWQMTADIANRLKKAKIKGYVSQMAYEKYRFVPQVELPDNVIVQVASTGPWSSGVKGAVERDRKLLQAWKKKIGKKLWTWNYFLNLSDGRIGIKGTVGFAPLATGKYYKTLAADNAFAGAFMECGRSKLTSFIVSHLEIYLATRIFWNNSLDPEEIVEEYCRLMFGPGGPEVKQFFDEVEKLHLAMRSKVYETDLGPRIISPTQFQVWNHYYTPEVLKKWTALFDKAQAKVRSDKLYSMRLKVIRQHFLEPALKVSREFFMKLNAIQVLNAVVPEVQSPVTIDGRAAEAAWKKSVRLYLSRMYDFQNPAKVTVSVMRSKEYLYLLFEYLDPQKRPLPFEKLSPYSSRIWDNATFEFFIDPDGSRKKLYQFAVNPANSLYSLTWPENKKWQGHGIKTASVYAHGSWKIEAAVPLKSLPGFREGALVNFSFNNNFPDPIDKKEKKDNFYSWSPYLKKGFQEPDAFGRLFFKEKNFNLIKDFDFRGLKQNKMWIGRTWHAETKNNASRIMLDSKNFITGGQSCFAASDNSCVTANTQLSTLVKFKLATRYQVSFHIKTKLAPKAFVAVSLWVGKNIFIPANHCRGVTPWQQITAEITTPAKLPGNCFFRVSLWGKGEFNIDHIVIREVK